MLGYIIKYCAKDLCMLVTTKTKKDFKPVIYIICCSVSVSVLLWKHQFTFPDIPFAINCNDPVRFLYAQGGEIKCSFTFVKKINKKT